ncbi:MAG: DUF309 domain-containing protein [Candidatus Omnitrophota bacterium]
MQTDERFKQGLALFNQGQFFECHDVIEELWLETDRTDPSRDLYKGVIQAAASLYQYKRGILSGAKALHQTSASNLGSYLPAALGLNVQKLIDDMDLFFEDPDKNPLPKLEYYID